MKNYCEIFFKLIITGSIFSGVLLINLLFISPIYSQGDYSREIDTLLIEKYSWVFNLTQKNIYTCRHYNRIYKNSLKDKSDTCIFINKVPINYTINSFHIKNDNIILNTGEGDSDDSFILVYEFPKMVNKSRLLNYDYSFINEDSIFIYSTKLSSSKKKSHLYTISNNRIIKQFNYGNLVLKGSNNFFFYTYVAPQRLEINKVDSSFNLLSFYSLSLPINEMNIITLLDKAYIATKKNILYIIKNNGNIVTKINLTPIINYPSNIYFNNNSIENIGWIYDKEKKNYFLIRERIVFQENIEALFRNQ